MMHKHSIYRQHPSTLTIKRFSNELWERFEGSTPQECLQWLLGEKLGYGMSREVYRFALDRRYVIKIELLEHRFQNVEEVITWQTVEYTKFKKWFAPVISISGCGRFMLQAYAKPLDTLPTYVPAFFTDLKPANWGMIGKQPVCFDYARTLLQAHGLSSKMQKAYWF